LTQLGVRFLFFGVVTAVFAAAVGSRPLLALGLAAGLLPIFSLATLPSPGGRRLIRLPLRLQAGVPAQVHVDHIRVRGWFSAPLQVRVEIDGWPPLTAWSEPQSPDAKACINFSVTPPTRGLLRRCRIVTVARDPLGLASAALAWEPQFDRISPVHPAAVAAPALPLRPTTDVPEFNGLRGWQPGDRPRDVDWRATARRPSSAPVVRLWQESPSRGGELVIGVAGGHDSSACDRVAELAAAAVRDAFRHCEQVTLRWFSGEVTARLAGPLLDALAEVPSIGMASPSGCDLLIVPSTAAAAGAASVWRVDGNGQVVAA
jgi:uncharacterized protein (DUF58 family)